MAIATDTYSKTVQQWHCLLNCIVYIIDGAAPTARQVSLYIIITLHIYCIVDSDAVIRNGAAQV